MLKAMNYMVSLAPRTLTVRERVNLPTLIMALNQSNPLPK